MSGSINDFESKLNNFESNLIKANKKVNEFKQGEEKRIQFVKDFTEKLYERFPGAFSGTLEEAQEEALEKYVYNENYWNYSYDEITKDLTNVIQNKLMEDKKDKADQYLKDVQAGNIQDNNVTRGLNNLAAGETFSVDASSDDTLKSDLSAKIEQYVSDVMTGKVTDNNVTNGINTFNNEVGKESFADNNLDAKGINYNSIDEPDGSELNIMLNESNDSKLVVEEKANTNAVQYTKSINPDNSQRGNASLFNIVLVVLGIATFILTAMILNLLLK